MSIIPVLPPAPGAPNLFATIVQDGLYTVAQGQYLYAQDLASIFASLNMFINPLVQGTVWSTVTSNVSTLITIGRFNNVRQPENRGLIVLETGPNVTANAVAFSETGFDNYGSVYVLAAGGNAALLQSSLTGPTINAGLVAVQSLTGDASAYSLFNSARLFNSGSILVEGQTATAIFMDGDTPFNQTTFAGIFNDGRIEAHSLGTGASVAIYLAHGFHPVEIVNRGIIKADIALVSDFNTTTARPNVEHITNEAGGRIEGLILLDRGNDLLTNRGTIVGDVYGEEGDETIDTTAGTIAGIVDLGWGADIFLGSAARDLVAGDDGNDRIEGNGGDDLLMGGGNDDRLIGGAGNDGLFGEYGNDLILTLGSDYASGGEGDDRIEAGDFAFERIDGGAGFDTLVLPSLGRALDLTTVLATGGLADIEQVQLSGNQVLAVWAADVEALTGGESSLRLLTGASDRIDLVGAWIQGPDQDHGGALFRAFSADGRLVLVAGGGQVVLGASGNSGTLDPTGGTPALLPGEAHGLGFTGNLLELNGYELHQSVTINPEQTWFSSFGPVLTSYASSVVLTNLGTILTLRGGGGTYFSPAFGVGASGNNIDAVINRGDIIVENLVTSVSGSGAWGLNFTTFSRLENHGSIEVLASVGAAVGADMGNVVNHGLITATVLAGRAIGVELEQRQFDNHGMIHAHSAAPDPFLPAGMNAFGRSLAIGALLQNGEHSNSGTIRATSDLPGEATAIWYEMGGGDGPTFTNSGTVIGETAIRYRLSFGEVGLTLLNGGRIEGKIQLDRGVDRITNSGTITGDVDMGAGADIFDGTAGIHTGRVGGGAGDDVLTGGVGNDVLVGDAGADRLRGGGGVDYFAYVGAGDSSAAALDRILDFQPGIDKIDLTWLPRDVGVALSEHTDPADATLYTLVSVTIPGAGTLVVRVDGRITLGDILLNTPIFGTEGPETLRGGGGPDEINGLGGDDTLEGLGGNDSLNGGAGNDVLSGGGGLDTLTGGPGDDTYLVDSTGDTIVEAAGGGTDTIRASISFDLPGEVENIVLTGFTGLLSTGNALANRMIGNGAANYLVGGAGDDILEGLAGNDYLSGDQGNDVLDGGAGIDHMQGGFGDDVYILGSGDTAFEYFGEGTDEVRTDAVSYALPFQIERLTGTSGSGQALTGNSQSNMIVAGAGDDILDGGQGPDVMRGGGGNDIYLADDPEDLVEEGAGAGIDEVRTISASYQLVANLEALTGLGHAQSLTGNALDNLITGTEGADRLDGAAGRDTMVGLAGDDIYVVDDDRDTVTEAAGAGVDEIRTVLASFILPDQVERLTGISAAGQTLIGNALANRIEGGAGADAMAGGAGDDRYIINHESDSVSEGPEGGVDTIESSVSFAIGSEVENLILTGSASAGTGNALANSITGNAAANLLDGGLGADRLAGGAGDDIYFADEADQVVENAGEGNDEIRTGVASFTLGDHVERLVGLSAAGQVLTGNGLGNNIEAGAGDDIIDGGDGADAMAGGAGADTYHVDDPADTIVELPGGGIDLVLSSATFTLGAELENLTLTGAGGIEGRGNVLANILVGNGAANTLAGAEGDDSLDGGAGADAMFGGAGNDIFYVDDAGDDVIELVGEGIDRVSSSVSLVLGAEVENLTLSGAAAIDGTGNGLANLITGNAAANSLSGGAGNDRLEGGGGDDQLDGGVGQDVLAGGLGNDQYVVTGDGDVIEELDGEGSDAILTALASYSLAGSSIENLIGLDSIEQTLTGNDLANFIDGGSGNDAMAGGLGNDTYVVDSVGDTVNELSGGGIDTVRTAIGHKNAPAYALYYIPAHVENLVGLSNSGQGMGGNALNNMVTAGAGADLIALHQGGVDNVNAGAGADYIWFGDTLTADDVVNGGLGRDTLAILGPYANLSLGANVTNIERIELFSSGGPFTYNITLADSVNTPHPNFFEVVALSLTSTEHLNFDGSSDTDSRYFLRGGAGNDVLRAGSGNDRIVANDGDDQLFGNAGSDVLIGGMGQDRIDGGAGTDTVEVLTAGESTSTTHDILTGFDPTADRINVSGTFAGWGASQAGGLNAANFDAMLAAGVDGALGANQAVKFTVTSGDQDGKTFVVYDADGDGSYTAGTDYVFQFVNPAPLEGHAIFF